MKPVESFDFVLFGATGDLAMRKLLPALYYRFRDSKNGKDWRIFGCARKAQSREEYVQLVSDSCREFVPAADFDEKLWAGFTRQIEYLPVDAGNPAGFAELARRLAGCADRVRIFYLSTSANLFAAICKGLADAALVTPLSRVVLEKPLGRDLASSDAINDEVGKIFEEKQIFRIDHYLGKEAVQNLIALRFGNAILEPLWDRANVRDVQITLAEQVGVEERAGYYDGSGALRDMVQNHLLQLLCILAMEPPSSIDPDAVRDEKLKVLRTLKPFTAEAVRNKVVRGQYRAGAIGGKAVVAYRDEDGVPRDSQTETFVSLKAEIDNWRWSGVPFYLRTGKRLAERVSEIVVNFRPVPYAILPPPASGEGNRLVIRLQPDDSVKLFMMVKVPGPEMKLRPVALDLDFAEAFKTRQWEAYERLIMDVVQGRLTLFMRRDELEAAWRYIDPIQETWAAQSEAPKGYPAGTWGPSASGALIARDGLSWTEDN